MAGEIVAGEPGRGLKEPLSLYIHVPFCRAKCCYCDFNSSPGLERLIPSYVRALVEEIRQRASALPANTHASTIYLGGGTPSLLNASEIASVLDACRSCFSLGAEAEISLEANPGTVGLASLESFREAGVNRLSLGVQSFDDVELKLLGRIHTATDAEQAFGMARSAGFANISLDLIYGLPRQPLETWRNNLERALCLRPDHLSLYALTIEEATSLGRDVAAGRLPDPDPDLAADMYLLAEEMLGLAGYEHYEISNWARPGKACRHNLVYWKNMPYLGFGAGAHSCYGTHRFNNAASPQRYVEMVNKPSNTGHPVWMGSAVEASERVAPELERAETMILGLRLLEGVSLREFGNRFSLSVDSLYADQIREMMAAGLLECDGVHLKLTQRGRLLGNEVFQKFLPSPS